MNGSRAMTGVRQMRARVRMLGKVHRIAPPSAQRLENQLAHALQGVEHAVAADGDRLDEGGVAHPLPPGLLDQMLARMGGVRRHLPLGRVVDRPPGITPPGGDRKSTRLNSSHSQISYAVFCLR